MLVGTEEFFVNHLTMTTITLHSALLFRSDCSGLNRHSTREQGEVLFYGRALVREQKAFLKCPVKKLPFHEVLRTVPWVMFRQGPL
jgi:hypothetical protein